MKKAIKKIDYAQLVANAAKEDFKIGNSVVILDTYKMNPVNDYEFTAFGNILIFVMKGNGWISVDGMEYKVQAPCVIMHLDGQKIRTHIEDDATQESMVFSNRFFEDIYISSLKLSYLRTTLINNPVLMLGDHLAVKSVKFYFNTMKQIAMFDDDMETAPLCAKFLTLSLFYGPMFRVLKKRYAESSFRSPQTTTDFLNLAEEHFKERQPLRYYAVKLNMSERHLYNFVRQSTGKSPGYWLEYYVFTEAKRLLENRGLSIQQVSDALSFANCPSFCRFFKRKQGQSPKDYRKYLTK